MSRNHLKPVSCSQVEQRAGKKKKKERRGKKKEKKRKEGAG